MINYIYGKISYVSKNYIILETSGIGYKINITNQNISVGEVKRIYIHSIIKSDMKNNIGCEMYGFNNPIERMLFSDLLQINGIGPIIANNIISLGYKEIISFIVSEDYNQLKEIKTVNEKIAKQIVLGLYDKYSKLADGMNLEINQNNTSVIKALKQLGYNDNDIKLALTKIDNNLELDENIGNCIRFIATSHDNPNS